MTALSLACIGAQTGRAAGQTAPPTAIQFTLDRPLDASDAPFVLASTRGLFRSENLGGRNQYRQPGPRMRLHASHPAAAIWRWSISMC